MALALFIRRYPLPYLTQNRGNCRPPTLSECVAALLLFFFIIIVLYISHQRIHVVFLPFQKAQACMSGFEL